jgi:hypothetical protein
MDWQSAIRNESGGLSAECAYFQFEYSALLLIWREVAAARVTSAPQHKC